MHGAIYKLTCTKICDGESGMVTRGGAKKIGSYRFPSRPRVKYLSMRRMSKVTRVK